MHRIAAALSILAVGCGGVTFGDLPRPAMTLYSDESGAGLCASTFAVDATGAVWDGRDCGGEQRPLGVRAMIDAAELADLSTQLDGVLVLPDDGDCEAPTWSGRRLRFRRTLPGTSEWPSKAFCEPGVEPAAAALAERIEVLAHGG